MQEFIWKYLIGPIVADARNRQEVVQQGVTAFPGYNLVNTLAYVLAAGAILYLVYRLFQRKEVELTASTALHSVPFMLLGGTLRFLEDAGAVPYPYDIVLVTPFIYMLIAAVYIPAVYYLEDRKILGLGTALLVPSLLFAVLQFQQFRPFYTAGTLVLAGFLTALYAWIVRGEYSSRELVAVAGSQFFGGAASMNAVFYDYTPKQLLAQYFNSFFGPPGVLVLKLGIVVLAVDILVDMEDGAMKSISLLALYAVGLGTGFRVFLRVAASI
jgi:uncharacterized membrane protein